MLMMLKIGYQKFILPNDKGLATLLKVLGSARVVESDDRYKGGGIDLETKPIDIGVEGLFGFHFVKSRAPTKSDAIEAEYIPPARGELPAGTGSALTRRQDFAVPRRDARHRRIDDAVNSLLLELSAGESSDSGR